VFNGDKDSRYAPLLEKINNARAHGAKALIFSNDEVALGKQRVSAKPDGSRLWTVVSQAHSEFNVPRTQPQTRSRRNE